MRSSAILPKSFRTARELKDKFTEKSNGNKKKNI